MDARLQCIADAAKAIKRAELKMMAAKLEGSALRAKETIDSAIGDLKEAGDILDESFRIGEQSLGNSR